MPGIDFSKGFRNSYYDYRTKEIVVWGWDENGERSQTREPYKPYLYVETGGQESDATSIFNTPLRRITFDSPKNRKDFITRHPTGRVFGSLGPEQQFLLDQLWVYDPAELIKQPLRVAWLDIEVHSPNEFPTADLAKHPINVISVFDSLTKTLHTWGTKPVNMSKVREILQDQNVIDVGKINIEYTPLKGEHALLEAFLNWWVNNYPDVVLGWNSGAFDIPYIINRLGNLIGEDAAKQLSPVGSIFNNPNALNIFMRPYIKWSIRGMAVLDYMEVYRTFSRGDSESYKLGDVAAKELGVSKISHTAGDLVTLADTDWDLFVAYNMQDVILLFLLDDRLRFMEIARTLSSQGFTSVEGAMGKVGIISGAMSKQAYDNEQVMPTFRPLDTNRGEYDGGYVREPKRGMCSSVVSYDANSLYPNTIITLNISPETKVGVIINYPDEKNDTYTIFTPQGTTKTLTKDQFATLLERGKCAVSAANVLYSQLHKGIVPQFIDDLYKKRVGYQKELNDIIDRRALIKEDPDLEEERKALKIKEEQIDILQYTIKILLNSVYGNFANQHSMLFDLDSAGSITLTGQAAIKEAARICNDWASKKFEKELDIIAYGDTDSIYVTLEETGVVILDDKGLLTPEGIEVVGELDGIIKHGIIDWAHSKLLTTDSRYVFKQETICSAAMFLQKKRYVLLMRYKDGRPVNKLKATGVELARSSLSQPVKDLMQAVVHEMFATRDMKKAQAVFNKAPAAFRLLPIDDIAKRARLGTFDKYAAKANGLTFGKGTHFAVKAGLAHNHLTKELGIDLQYPAVRQGDKVKLVSVIKNHYGVKILAYSDKFPVELGMDVDYNEMFKKMIKAPVERFFEAIDWNLFYSKHDPVISLEDAFG